MTGHERPVLGTRVLDATLVAASCARTMRDEALNDAFCRDGFVVIDAVDPAQLGEIERAWDEIYTGSRSGMHTSTACGELEYRRGLDQLVRGVLAPVVAEHLHRHLLAFGGAAVKFPGNPAPCSPHQDWTFVDESRFRSAHVWLPLTSTDRTHGAFVVVPGSHDTLRRLRTSPHPLATYEHWISDLELARLVTVDVAPGQAVVYDSALIHGSWPHLGAEPRVAIIGVSAPAEADLYHYVVGGDGAAREYAVPSGEWFTRCTIGAEPTDLGPGVPVVVHGGPPVTEADLHLEPTPALPEPGIEPGSPGDAGSAAAIDAAAPRSRWWRGRHRR